MKPKTFRLVVGPAIVVLVVCGCQAGNTTADVPGTPVGAESGQGKLNPEEKRMMVKSSFEDGARIDKRHSGEGQDLSPHLAWSGAPEGTQSFALICDDPDAPSPKRPSGTPWVHWVIYNIPATASELPEGIPRVAEPKEVPGARQGLNSWDRDNVGYRGPMPPPGSGAHRYFFKVYALDIQLSLEPRRARKDALLKAMQGHVLAEGQLMGKYER
jgi:Raf kinase inhibitor-like YbhB/YbcL family protein